MEEKNGMNLYKVLFPSYHYKEYDEYFQVICPFCKKFEAFLYKNSFSVVCNRKNSCGRVYKLKKKSGQFQRNGFDRKSKEKYFLDHGIDLSNPRVKKIFGNNNSDFSLKFSDNAYCKLIWDKSSNKYRYILPKGWNKSKGDFISPFKFASDAKNNDVLYIMAGIADWIKAIEDGLCATTSIFGEMYLPMDSTISWMRKFSKIVIVYDNDKAGMKGRIRLCSHLVSKGLNVFVKDIGSTNGIKDYCDFRLKYSLSKFLNSIEYRSISELNPACFFDEDLMLTMFNELYGDLFMFIEDGSVAYYNGKFWELHRKYSIEYSMFSGIGLSLRDFISTYDIKNENDEKFLEMLSKFRKKFNNKNLLKHLIDRMSFSISINRFKMASFESNPNLFLAKNCVVDLKENKKLDFNREFYQIRRSPVVYDPSSRCDTWKKFIEEIFSGNRDKIDFVQKALGYSITGLNIEHMFFICYGNGRNGKSLMLKVIEYILGDYASQISFSTFTQNRNGDNFNHDLADLIHKRLVIASECTETRMLNESKIKTITGGERVHCRKLYREFFTYYPTFKIWLTTNYKPKVLGTDNGIWSRLKFISFEESFAGREDKNLFKKLIKESSGILNWLIEGYRKYLDEGLYEPDCIRKEIDEYRIESDVIQRFLDSCCVVYDGESTDIDDFMVSSSLLYQRYKEWVQENGECPMSHVRFSRKIKEKGFSVIHTRIGKNVFGIKLI